MVRTQVQLTAEQARAVKRLAADRGVSMAEVVRESIDAFLGTQATPGPEELRERARRIVGIVTEGPADVSARHDDYAAEAFDN